MSAPARRQPRGSPRTVVHPPRDTSEVWRPQDAGLLRELPGPAFATRPAQCPRPQASGTAREPRNRGAARPRTHRRTIVKLIPAVIIAADVAVVTYVEKVLLATHTPQKELIITGLVFALPVLILLLLSWLRGQGTAQAAPRPGSTFGPRR